MSHSRNSGKNMNPPTDPSKQVYDPSYYHPSRDPELIARREKAEAERVRMAARRQASLDTPSATASSAGLFKQMSLPETFSAPAAPTPKR